MTRLGESSHKVEQKQHAQANNSVDAHEEGVAENGGEEITLLFSKELATRINPKRPDITAALIIYGLYLWQKMTLRSFKYVPMVNGKRGAYRSLSELSAEYPWLSEEAIRKTLNRAEKALNGWFLVDRDNPKAERGKLHFWISPNLIKAYRFNAEKKKGLLQLRVSDVVNFGVLEAILISNLEYVTDAENNTNPLTDDEGRIYRELSPSKLTVVKADRDGVEKSILPCKRNKLTEALAHLEAELVMIEHHEKKGFYRLERPSPNVSKVDGDVSKVAGRVSKVASGVSKVAGENEVMRCNPFADEAFRAFQKTSDTNTCSNPDSNSDSKCILHPTVELRSSVGVTPSKISPCAKKLMELVNEGLAAYRQKPVGHGKIIYDKDEFCEGTTFYHPVTDIEMPSQGWHEHLPYDFVAKDFSTGKPYSRKREIKEALTDIRLSMQISGFAYTADDMDTLHQLFVAHPQLEADHIFTLLDFLNPQSGKLGFVSIRTPKYGHDCFRWARCIKNMRAFLRYLPQLAKEFYIYETGNGGVLIDIGPDDKGRPIYNYDEMPEPYLSLAFAEDRKNPVHYKNEENEEGDWVWRPVFYPELVKLPTIEVVKHECNPIREAV